ncbi:protein shuttle craft isoform X2 [Agrilus planipennis]|nr:protein shuttle craft isoform X2 [Agrilus planipennis]XP_025832982.1 protein shuttle craft isoform X2 [Agrilus planipennis]
MSGSGGCSSSSNTSNRSTRYDINYPDRYKAADHVDNSNIPVLSSTLTPEAKEFKPNSNLYCNIETSEPSISNGAVRKNYKKSYYYSNQNYNRKNKGKDNNYNEYMSRGSDRKKYQKNREQDIRGNLRNMREDSSNGTDFENDTRYFPKSNDSSDYYRSVNNYNKNYYKQAYPNEFGNRSYRRNYNTSQKENFSKSYGKYTNSKTDLGSYNIVSKKENYQEISSVKPEIKPKKYNTSASNSRAFYLQKLNKKLDNVSQRERLEELIVHCLLECLVCYEKLKHHDKVWSCKQCYHVLHLNCVTKWAESSKMDSGWRCPACQNIYLQIPEKYVCYCGKITDPPYLPGHLPHSCDEVCGRKNRFCSHNCTLLCHPGPCPDCSIMVTRSCSCGSTVVMIKCSSKVPIQCSSICNKPLNCGSHKCTKVCHEGDCGPCKEIIKQECYCYKQGRVVSCTTETTGKTLYSCGENCEKLLECSNHKCQQMCHDGICNPCCRSPGLISTCPCGKKKLGDDRKSCLDPIPSCGQTCGKMLKCGQPGAHHFCKELCHEGDCPICPLTTSVKCRCGLMDKEMPCAKLTTRADDARCQKKCTKKRSCGKHKCNQNCCIDIEHICPLPCSRMLSCGNHRCDRTCHKGRCPPCLQSSFDELYCECGTSVIMPPVPCGTRPPACSMPCSRTRSCGHDPLHSCHSGSCPPCTVLIKTWCYGQHEQRATIPCHQQSFSCGLPCGKPMPCGRHNCIKPCHLGPCPQPCKQPCIKMRPGCGHQCNQPCHDPPCPETSCKQMVKVTCQCGLRFASKICLDLIGEYQTIAMSHLASKMEEIQRGETVDLSDLVVGKQTKKSAALKALECNDECRVVERNRRMAIALQVSGSDFQQKIIPKYSDYMRQWAKKNPTFCQYVHNKLTELVELAKQSRQKSRSFSFETMNKEKRHFVHEYCEHFGCESAAYDPEPNRNVVATALREKSFFPSYSLLEIIQRENGQRKVPGPQQLEKGQRSSSESVSMKVSGRLNRPPTPPGEYVDYFDQPPA